MAKPNPNVQINAYKTNSEITATNNGIYCCKTKTTQIHSALTIT